MNLVKPPNIIDLKKDLAFKLYFKGDTGVLISLLEHFLPLPPGSRIESVEVMDGEANTPHLAPAEKDFLLDFRAQIRRKEDGKLLPVETINVEMQCDPQSYFTNRLLAYASRLYTAQIKPGPEGYKNLFPVYSLAFCANNLREFASIPDRHYHLCTIRREDTDPSRQPLFCRGIQFVVVELAKFAKQTGDLLDLRDAWCYLLKQSPNMSKSEFEAIRNKGKEMGNAVNKLWELSEEEHIRIRIEAREKQRMDQLAREQYQREEGREEGRAEVALQMLGIGMDIPTVCKCTGLTPEEVEALKPRKK